MFAPRSLLLYWEKHSPVGLTIPELVICGLRRSSLSLKEWGLSCLQLFIWSPVFVKHLAHIYTEGCPPLPKRRNPVPAVWSQWQELWKVASRDWIKKDYIIKVVPFPLKLDAPNIVYPYEYTDVFQDESLNTIPSWRQASIYNRCLHFCPSNCLPHSFAAALWCHCCELKMNLHPSH